MAKYFAIVPDTNGNGVRVPFLQWIKSNRHQLPSNFQNSDGTTHEWKRRLTKMGWKESAGVDTVFVIKPDENGSIEYAGNYLDELDTESEEREAIEEAVQEVTFGLERDLQNALRQNIQSLEDGLEIIDGGREKHTEAGFIDITARDAQGRIVVIELKAPVGKPEVIAQTLAYMEAVKNKYKSEVRGIIIASGFVDRVKIAARQVPNLKLVTYAFQFNFNEVD